MTQINTDRWIARLTVLLFITLAGLSFALSYDALQHLATEHGKPGWRGFFWPFLIDGGLIIFSLAVYWFSRNRFTTWKAWLLVGLFTAATIWFNYVYAGANPINKLVAIAAPLVLFFTFETLMDMLRKSVTRQGVVMSIDALEKERHEKGQQLTVLIDQLTQRLNGLRQQVNQVEARIGATVEATVTPSEAEQRQRRIIDILIDQPGVSKAELARRLGVTRQTAYRDIRALMDAGHITEADGVLVARNGNGARG